VRRKEANDVASAKRGKRTVKRCDLTAIPAGESQQVAVRHLFAGSRRPYFLQ
jgi:hypothetical protein